MKIMAAETRLDITINTNVSIKHISKKDAWRKQDGSPVHYYEVKLFDLKLHFFVNGSDGIQFLQQTRGRTTWATGSTSVDSKTMHVIMKEILKVAWGEDCIAELETDNKLDRYINTKIELDT